MGRRNGCRSATPSFPRVRSSQCRRGKTSHPSRHSPSAGPKASTPSTGVGLRVVMVRLFGQGSPTPVRRTDPRVGDVVSEGGDPLGSRDGTGGTRDSGFTVGVPGSLTPPSSHLTALFEAESRVHRPEA